MSIVTFSPLSEFHFPLLQKWLETPHVKKFWDINTTWTEELIANKFNTYVLGYKVENSIKKPLKAFVIEINKAPIGYIQYYNAYDFPCSKLLVNLPLSLAALDFFIGEEHYLQKGIGATCLKQFLATYIDPNYQACLVDPDCKNIAAIRTYKKVGFKEKILHEDTQEILMLRENLRAPIHFEKLSTSYQNLIFEWLEQPYVKEFWDNSKEHRDDILNFINGRKAASPYFNGIFDYWLGFINKEPCSLLMTSEILANESDLPDALRNNLSTTGKTFSIDFMIGNLKFLGQGLAAPTLQAFTEFMKNSIDRTIDTFIIDPKENNPRAIHVYQKAGFILIKKFDYLNGKNVLMVKKLCL